MKRTSSRPIKRARAKDAPRFSVLRSNNRSSGTVSQKAVMTYFDTKALNPGAGTNAIQVYAANGLFDPDITGVGHQPAGFDQYMALFNEYVVTGSTIKCTFSNSSTTAGVIVGISLVDYATTSADPRVYVENGNTVWTTLGTFGSGADIKALSFKADISKFSTQSIIDEDNFCGNASNNPGDVHYFHIWVCSQDFAADPSATTVVTELRYDALFRDHALNNIS